jgi:hypothetical protein
MHRVRFAVAALMLFPSVATAQKKSMGGSKEADWNNVATKSAPAGPTISSKDFEKASPYKLMLDKKKDLKLTDAQQVAAKEADAKLLAENAERFKLVDSLKKDARPKTSGTPSTEDELRMVLARDALGGVVRDIRTSFDAAAKAGLPDLDEAQQKTSQELMKKYDEEMQDMLREKMGGRGGAPSGGSGGRGGGKPPVQ